MLSPGLVDISLTDMVGRRMAYLRSLCIFFFSSRRRHTRYWRDWSSDVCSSDLLGGSETLVPWTSPVKHIAMSFAAAYPRSEERRVGKEGRSRGAPYH